MATLYDNYTGTASPYLSVSLNAANDWAGQSFTTSVAYNISQIDLYLAKGVGDDVGTIIVGIYAVDGSGHPAGGALVSGTIANAVITEVGTYTWNECALSSAYALSNNTKYCIVVHGTSLDVSNVLEWPVDDLNDLSDFAGGDAEYSTTGGVPGGWSTDITADHLFKCWGDTAPQFDKVYSKSLVAIGNHEVWYESPAGTMKEFTDANAQINTSAPLTVTEAFQKLFIANETNLKVADFINTKLTTDTAATNSPEPGTVLIGDTSTAKMVVDYIAANEKTIYGKRITAATFAAEKISGTTAAGLDIDFDTNDAEDAPPHWYDWTVFGNVADADKYGVMPDSAYLVCRYRARLVLAGNPDYPHQWYMSKIGFPFNFLYGTNDPMTAVAGTNANAGELGDIIRALIPFGDDFLIFACANSIHLLDGDPAAGGSIDELDNKTGIFGPWAWCIDGVGDLWFYGTGGLYKMVGGRSKPVNVSQSHLPQLVDTWAALPGTHRVVLTYDPYRNGIIISRTTLDGGANLNYWYDLRTEGFYPETYPTACGIFSSHYYDSDATATKGLVLGCNDGYIRNFYNADKNDDVGTTNRQISSYAAWPIQHLTEDNDRAGKLTSLTIELAGGGAGGDFGDTEEVSYSLYVGDDAETCLEKMKAVAAWATGQPYVVGDLRIYLDVEYICIVAHTSAAGAATHEEPDTNTVDWETAAHSSGTLTGTGRKARIRTKVRGAYLGLKFYNEITVTDWATDVVYAVDDLVAYSNIEYVCIVAHTSEADGGTHEEPDTNTTDWTATTAQTWAINRVFGDVRPAGKIK